ncbi:hypothetical protein [Candidatus Pelagadaptatus aseana]|uniref:hypothetical protein n=1 Tax=Candidatus Pelagadaptatus aseana TaxID=3120508 RepID=UPI003C6F3EA5
MFNRLGLIFWRWFNFRGLNLVYRKLSLEDSYNFIYKSSSTSTVLYKSQEELREKALMSAPKSGMVLEFGVFLMGRQLTSSQKF